MTTHDVIIEKQGGEQPIRYVLFVCNHNAGCSHQTCECQRRDNCDLIAVRKAS